MGEIKIIIKKRLSLFLLSILFSIFLIASVSAIEIRSLSELYTGDPIRIFEFIILNNDSSALNSVNFTVDTKDNDIINSTENINLAVGENISVFVAHNFSSQGDFNVNVTASNGTLTDSENLTITISNLMVTELRYLYFNKTEFIFEIVVNSTDGTTLTDINWSLDIGNGSIINSSYPFNLSFGEHIRIYVRYNYSLGGNYDVTARAYNSIYDSSKTVTFNTNTSPVISELPDVTFKEDSYNDTIDLDDYVTDEDADADLIWTATGNTSTTIIIEILADHRINIVGSEDYNNEPNGHNITFIVTDTDGLTSNDTILVTIDEDNDPPNITSYTPQNLTQFVPANGQLQFNHTSEDVEGAPLTYNWSLDGIQQATTQNWSFQPTTADAGEHIVNLTVSDGTGGNDSIQWGVTVYLTYCDGKYNTTMGDWDIDSNVKCENETIPMEANVNVKNGGNFTLKNITLKMNCINNGQYGITVESGGNMYIYDLDNDKTTTDDRSIIQKGGDGAYTFIVESGTEFEMKNSELNGSGFNGNNRGLEISADNSIIQNNEITANYNGLTILSDNNLIENNNFTGNTKACIEFNNANQSNITLNDITGCDYGILFKESSHNTITFNNISSNNQKNIFFEKTQQIGPSLYNVIKSNTITNSDVGIFIGEDCSYNNITNNTVDDHTSEGVYLHKFASRHNIINNTITNNDVAGIYLFDSQFNYIKGSIISSNDVGIQFRNGTGTVEEGSHHNIIQDSIIANSVDKDIRYRKLSYNNTLINTTFDETKLDLDGGDSNLTVKWYLDIYVNDSNGNDMDDVLVIGSDRNNSPEFSEATNSSGDIPRQTLEEYTRFKDGPQEWNWHDEFKTNYTITAHNLSHRAEAIINLTESKSITLTLQPVTSMIHDLSILNEEGVNRTFEFFITNYLSSTLNQILWRFDTGDNYVINSTTNISLTPFETAIVYLKYGFSSTGTYNVNATAINNTLQDSESMSVTIS